MNRGRIAIGRLRWSLARLSLPRPRVADRRLSLAGVDVESALAGEGGGWIAALRYIKRPPRTAAPPVIVPHGQASSGADGGPERFHWTGEKARAGTDGCWLSRTATPPSGVRAHSAHWPFPLADAGLDTHPFTHVATVVRGWAPKEASELM